MSRKLFGIGLVLCVLMAVARAQTDSAPDYDYEDGLDEVDELDEEPMIKRCGTTECTTSTQTYGGSTDSTQPNGGTTDSTQTYGGSTNADKPKKKKKKFKGIDFSKARGHSYVRFVLASSVGFPNTNTTPMVIDTQEVRQCCTFHEFWHYRHADNWINYSACLALGPTILTIQQRLMRIIKPTL